MRMNGYQLRIDIRADLLNLFKAAMVAKSNRIAAMDMTVDQFRDLTEAPAQLRDNIQAAALNTEKFAFANIGQFIFDRMEEFEAELEEFQRLLNLRDQDDGRDDDDYPGGDDPTDHINYNPPIGSEPPGEFD